VKRDVVSAAAPAVLRNWRRSVGCCAMASVVSGFGDDGLRWETKRVCEHSKAVYTTYETLIGYGQLEATDG
jgi:hypothetical protein